MTEHNKEQQEAFERIKTEFPAYTKQAEQDMKDGKDLTELLAVLDSFY